MKVEFYKHNLTTEDKEACMEVLDSIFLTTGQVVKDFETDFANYLKLDHAVGLTSCTSALFLALKYFDVKEGDEVITTPLSFIATSNAIEFCGAKPVFVDVEENTGNLNADLIENAITPQTKAIIPVHLYGQLCEMEKIRSIANKHDLKVIEDAAHCIEGNRGTTGPGALGDMVCFSFYATKNLACGEGGAIACNDPATYEWLIKARLHGMSMSAADRYNKKFQHYDMEFLGYKSNMSNIQASLMFHQLGRLEDNLKKREEVCSLYDQGFADNPKVSSPTVLEGVKHARHLYPIWVDRERRDNYIEQIQEEQIGVAVNFNPIHLMKYYAEKYGYQSGDYPQAEKIGASTITLPLYAKLTTEEVAHVVDTVNKATKQGAG